MKYIVLLIIFVFSIQSAADCRPDYDNYQRGVTSLRNTLVSSSLAQSGVLMASNFVKDNGRLGVVLNSLLNKRGFWIIFGAATAGAYVTQYKLSDTKIKTLLDEAYAGRGPLLSSFASDEHIPEKQLADIIVQLNETDQFCTRSLVGNDRTITISDLKSEDEALRLIKEQIRSNRLAK